MLFVAFLAVLVSEQITVPASHWRTVELGRPAAGTRLECTFDVRQDARVQVMLLSKAQAERFLKGRSTRGVADSGWDDHGELKYHLDGGGYVLVVDNRINHRASDVELHVVLHPPTNAVVQTVPPERRDTIIALSLLFFGSTVALTAWQFLRNQ